MKILVFDVNVFFCVNSYILRNINYWLSWFDTLENPIQPPNNNLYATLCEYLTFNIKNALRVFVKNILRQQLLA